MHKKMIIIVTSHVGINYDTDNEYHVFSETESMVSHSHQTLALIE